MKLLDTFGHDLQLQDLVVMDEGTKQIRWQIQEMRPSVNPAHPPGAIMVAFTAYMEKPFESNVRTHLIRILTKEEATVLDQARAPSPAILP